MRNFDCSRVATVPGQTGNVMASGAQWGCHGGAAVGLEVGLMEALKWGHSGAINQVGLRAKWGFKWG